jgi:hypothetical protein
MKKMNFVFRSRVFNLVNSRLGLMIFAILLLVGFGFNTVSAQYVSTEVAIQRLKGASEALTKNWETLQNTGDQLAINRGNLELLVVSRMLTDLKEGATVKNTVEKYIGYPNKIGGQDYRIASDNTKNDYMKNWLNDNILKLLKL